MSLYGFNGVFKTLYGKKNFTWKLELHSELNMSDCFHLLSLLFRMDNCLFLVVKVNYSIVSLILCSR